MKETADLFATTGDPLYKHDSMLVRRRIAALCGQHRVVQRLDKQIALLRADLGLPPISGEEMMRTHLVSKDPLKDNNLNIAGEEVVEGYDREWARRATSRGVARLVEKAMAKGYSLSRNTRDGVTRFTLTGVAHGKRDVIELRVLAPSQWCVGASRNGKRMPLFDHASAGAVGDDRGVPEELASESWEGSFSPRTVQRYGQSWASLLNMI
jgi:hypothetical protein